MKAPLRPDRSTRRTGKAQASSAPPTTGAELRQTTAEFDPPLHGPGRVLLRFIVTAGGVFVLLILPWPGLQEFYAGAYRSGAQWVFRGLGREGPILFFPASDPALPHPPDGDRHKDTCATWLAHFPEAQGAGPKPRMGCGIWSDSRLKAYLPSVKLVALVLATPVAWARRWRALFWGLIHLHFFILGLMGLQFLASGKDLEPCRLFSMGPWSTAAVTWLERYVAQSTTPIFMVPVLIWILVTLRPDDIRWILSGPKPSAAGVTTEKNPAP